MLLFGAIHAGDGLVQPSVKYLQGLAAGVWTVAAVCEYFFSSIVY